MRVNRLFSDKKEYFKKDETIRFNKLLSNLDRRGLITKIIL